MLSPAVRWIPATSPGSQRLPRSTTYAFDSTTAPLIPSNAANG
jgi:hypothetical protein